jgi:hypothetical protein
VDLASTDTIRLSLPVTSASVRIARAGAAGLATRAGFTYHEVEQLQLAVGEAAALLVPEPGSEGRVEGGGALTLTFEVERDGLRIALQLTDRDLPGAPPEADVPPIAAAVLRAAVDEWHVLDGGRRVVLVKRVSDVDDDSDDD